LQRPLVRKLVESVETRVGELGLKAEVSREKDYLTEITVYATALAMNYVARGKFFEAGTKEVKPKSKRKQTQMLPEVREAGAEASAPNPESK
jgi:hypothetical protein